MQCSVCAWGEASFGLHFHRAIGKEMTFFKSTLELFAHAILNSYQTQAAPACVKYQQVNDPGFTAGEQLLKPFV